MGIMFVVFMLLCVYTVEHSCNSVKLPTVSIEMDEVGFHRDLKYNIQFDDNTADENCEYILEQTLPAAVYINKDQLNDLQRLYKLSAIYPNTLDVEASTEKSKPFIILLIGVPIKIETIKLPIHFRYHAPSDNKSFVTVDIVPPKMYLKCFKNQNMIANMQFADSSIYCRHDNGFVKLKRIMTSEVSTDECGWRLIQATYNNRSSLSANIPVGNEKALPPILYATIIFSWVISIWTVFRTRLVPRRINYKLNGQRILENKIKHN